MPEIMQESLFNAFRQFSYINFFVKFESLVNNTNVIIKITDNVYFTKWMPQIDLIGT